MDDASAKVLVVDDEDIVLSLLRRSLQKAGYQVITAKSGIEALESFRADAANIVGVVLDLSMPHMSGEETFDAIKKVKPDVRVILSSGFAQEDAFERFSGRDIAGFIQKPFRPQELMARAKEVFGPSSQ